MTTYIGCQPIRNGKRCYYIDDTKDPYPTILIDVWKEPEIIDNVAHIGKITIKVNTDRNVRVVFYANLYKDGSLVDTWSYEEFIGKDPGKRKTIVLDIKYRGIPPGNYELRIKGDIYAAKFFPNWQLTHRIPEFKFNFTVKGKPTPIVDYKSLFMLMMIGLIAVAAISAITGR